MDNRQILRRRVRAGIGRRDLGKLMAGVGLAAVMAPMGARRAFAAADLTVFEWSGYDDPSMCPEFVEQYGAPPEYAIFAEEEEAYQKLRAGFRVDLSHPCTLSVGRWRDAGLIKPVDTSRIPRWNTIPSSMLEAEGIQHEGQIWFMPFDWGNSTILYREDELPDARQSYELLLDPKLRGRVSVFDSVDEVFVIAAGILGYDSHMNLTDEQIENCGEVLRQLHQNIRFYWADPTQLQQAIASSEVLAAWAWTDSYLALRGSGVPIKFMFPEEGLSTWMCGFVMNTNAPGDEQAAYDYMNATLDPQVGKMLIDDWGYGHANAESYKLAESELAKELGLTEDIRRFLDGTRFQGEIEPTQREKMIELFSTIKLGG